MQNSIPLGAIMGKLNILLPFLPEQVRPEITTFLLMPVNKTKGEIEARLAQSRSSHQQVQGAEKKLSKEVDPDMERLIRSAEGPSLSREFDDLLKALKTSLNNNHLTYKKALDKIINFIRVIMVNHDIFLHKRILINANDSGTDRCMQVSLNYLVSRRASELDIFIIKVKVITREDTMLLTELRDAQVAAFPKAYLQPRKEGNLPKTQINKDDFDDDEQKKDDQNPSGSNPSQSSKPSGSKSREKKKEDDKKDEEKKIKRVISLLKDKDTVTRAWRSVLAEWLIEREETNKRNEAEAEEEEGEFIDSGYPKLARQKLVEALSGTPIIEELEILDHLKDVLREEEDTQTVFT
ncbi:hypothetical protein AgCh_035489 [Apium graveolens]